MNRVRKIFIGVAAALLALLTIAVTGVSFYLGSEPVRQQIVSELQKALKMPVSIEGASFTPWDGAVLKGLRITETEVSEAPTFLHANEVRIKVALLPLFHNEAAIREIFIAGPRITGRQSGEGRLILPKINEVKKSESPADDAVRTEKTAKPKRPAPAIRLGTLRIENANIEIADFKGNLLVTFAGVSVRAFLRPEGVAAGSIRVDRVQTTDYPPLAFLQTPFTYTADGIELSDLSGEFAGGKLAGSANLGFENAQPFRAKLKVMGVDLARFTSKTGGDIGGRLMMELDLKGEAARVDSLRGHATAEITQGRLASTPWLQALGILLEVPELVNAEFAHSKAELRIKGQDARVENLALNSENLRLTATGSVKKFDKLSLDARLHVSPQLHARLPAEIAKAFDEPDESDWLSLPFDINGTLKSPKTNLQKKLLREAAKGAIGGLLNDLLGPSDDPVPSPEINNTQPPPAPPLPIPLESPPSGANNPPP